MIDAYAVEMYVRSDSVTRADKIVATMRVTVVFLEKPPSKRDIENFAKVHFPNAKLLLSEVTPFAAPDDLL